MKLNHIAILEDAWEEGINMDESLRQAVQTGIAMENHMNINVPGSATVTAVPEMHRASIAMIMNMTVDELRQGAWREVARLFSPRAMSHAKHVVQLSERLGTTVNIAHDDERRSLLRSIHKILGIRNNPTAMQMFSRGSILKSLLANGVHQAMGRFGYSVNPIPSSERDFIMSVKLAKENKRITDLLTKRFIAGHSAESVIRIGSR